MNDKINDSGINLFSETPNGNKSIIEELIAERVRQEVKWGEQNHRDGTQADYLQAATIAKYICERARKEGRMTWYHILNEEVQEAFCETDPAALRAELIQVAAVAIAWIGCIDRRQKT